MATKTFSAQVRQFADLTKKQMRKVAIDSIQDVLEAAQTSAQGKIAGGTLIEGRIPVVSSDLIKSLTSSLSGGVAQQGAASYAVVLADLELGDRAEFSWTMEYAFRVHEGFTGTDELGREYQQEGWHWVTPNAARFSEFVEANARKVRA